MTYFKKKTNQPAPRQYTGIQRDTVESVSKLPTADLGARGISEATASRYGVRMAVSETDGRTPIAHYFPYYDQQGKLTGYKKRDLTVDKYDDWHFTTVGKVGADCKLFGQTVVESLRFRAKKLLFVEGEYDVLSVAEATTQKNKGTQYEAYDATVVGLSCGTGNADAASASNEHFLCQYESLVLGFDNDSASEVEARKGIMKGKEATEVVATTLMRDGVLVAEYPEPHKDPSDMLVAGQGADLYGILVFASKPFSAEKINEESELGVDELIEVGEQGFMVPSLPKLSQKFNGFRKGELGVLTALSGVGKTTIMAEIAYSLMEQGNKVGFIFLEETRKKTRQRMVARKLGVPYKKFKGNPLQFATLEQINQAKAWLDDKLVVMDHFGSIQTSKLMGKIKSMVYINKVDFVMFDHISMAISGLGATNERQMLDVAMTELAAFCAANPVGVLVNSHLNRNAADEIRNLSEMTEPKWICTKKEDLRGSSALEQLPWYIIGVDMEINPDRTRGRVRVCSLKNREYDELGEADVLQMNPVTGILEDAGDREDF